MLIVNTRPLSRIIPRKDTAWAIFLTSQRGLNSAELARRSTSAERAASVFNVSAIPPKDADSVWSSVITLAATDGNGGRFFKVAAACNEVLMLASLSLLIGPISATLAYERVQVTSGEEKAGIAVKKGRVPLPEHFNPEKSTNLQRLPNSSNRVMDCKWTAQTLSALIVDDDPAIPPLVELALERYAISSDSVSDAASAIERLRSHQYDLVVLDLAMPEISGFDVLLVLKRTEALRKIPVIVLTASDNDEALARSFGYGADDFVVKPFRTNELGMRAYRLLYPLVSQCPPAKSRDLG